MVGSHRPGKPTHQTRLQFFVNRCPSNQQFCHLQLFFVLKTIHDNPMFFLQTMTRPIKCFWCVFFILRWFLVALPIRCFILTIFVKSVEVFCIYTISSLSVLRTQDIFGRVVLKNTITLEQKKINIYHNMNQPKKTPKNDKCSTKKSFQITLKVNFSTLHVCLAPWHSCGQLWLLLCLHWKRLLCL